MPKKVAFTRAKPRRLGVMAARLVVGVVVIAAGVWAYGQRGAVQEALHGLVADKSGAKIERILVEGAVYSAREDIAEALGVARGDALMGFDVKQARARLEALPWVRLAAVERRLPDTVHVDIYEHTPVARVEHGSQIMLLAKTGDVFAEDAENTFASLPLLQGEGAADQAANFMALFKDYPNFAGQLQAANWVAGRRWDLHFKSGVTVKLPQDNPVRALGWLQELEQSRHILSLNAGEIDLRLNDRITLNIPPDVGQTPAL